MRSGLPENEESSPPLLLCLARPQSGSHMNLQELGRALFGRLPLSYLVRWSKSFKNYGKACWQGKALLFTRKASTSDCSTASTRFSRCYFAGYGSFATSSPKGANVFRKNYLTDGHCFFKTRFLVTGGLRESSRKFMWALPHIKCACLLWGYCSHIRDVRDEPLAEGSLLDLPGIRIWALPLCG